MQLNQVRYFIFCTENFHFLIWPLGPTAMKSLFVDEKPADANQTLAPSDGSVAIIFGSPGQFFFLENTEMSFQINALSSDWLVIKGAMALAAV